MASASAVRTTSGSGGAAWNVDVLGLSTERVASWAMDESDRSRLEAVGEVWRTAPTLEDALASVEAAVVRWAWFTESDCCSLEPYKAQRMGIAPGRVLAGEPDVIAWVVRGGFDERDRPVVSSTFGHERRVVANDVRFFEGDTCRELHFDERGRLVWVTIFDFEQDVLVRQASHQQDGSDWAPTQYLWEYFYGEGGRLERSRRRGWGGGYPAETRRREAAGTIEAFEYDDQGRLSRITAWTDLPGYRPELVYRRSTRASRATRLVTGLVEAIEAGVSRCCVDEKVWCLALHYDRQSPFPPDVVFGLERERKEWGSDVDLLNPAEWSADGPPRRLALEDPELLDLCASVWDALSCQHEAPARAVKLLNLTAKRLNQSGLRHHLDATDDFFVYAVDLELEDLDGNLRAALGKARYRELVNSGLTSP